MDLKTQAELLTKDLRRQIIMAYTETNLHKALKELFQKMHPNYTVEITHGPQELGKDLVIIKSDEFGSEVFGVVVKCGHIRGKTAEDVDLLKEHIDNVFSKAEEKRLDEIKSQIQQALAHPAEMK
ncbi:MAG: restriction endonuclease [Candidatus Poribacteria bacterium]|nr:restriction endonuclease [Candidatus Poribacteria bacterium]